MAKLPEVSEEDVDTLIKMVIEKLIDSKFLHTAIKPDNAKRIIRDKSISWDKKLIYSWDYEGPEVGLARFMSHVGHALFEAVYYHFLLCGHCNLSNLASILTGFFLLFLFFCRVLFSMDLSFCCVR